MEGATTGAWRPGLGRLAAMALFAVVAVGAFLILADVRFNVADDLWFDGVSDIANRQGMTILMLALEAMALTGVLMLLFIRPYAAATQDEAWVSTGGTHVGGDTTRVQIGCPGCGTVFEKPYSAVDEPHEQDFRCPNCGRAGHLRMGLHKSVSVRTVACGTCGQSFTAYRDTAECPHCHAAQA